MQNLVAPIFQMGQDSDIVLSASAAVNSLFSAVTGSQYSTSLAVTTPASFVNGDLVLIIQVQGTGALQMEWNIIQSVNGNASPFVMAIPLSYNYTTGAQMIKFPRYRSFTQNSGVNINNTAWDGARYGYGGLFCRGTATFNGNINMNGYGFRGGAGGGFNTVGNRGEGTVGANNVAQTAANGNGGGGGGYSTNGPWDQGNGGAGGVNSSGNSQNGTGSGGGLNQGGGPGIVGNSISSATLDAGVPLGGGGGGGGGSGGVVGTVGGSGGGSFIIVAKRIVLGATASFTFNGNNGTAANYKGGCGGSGGGGSLLMICEEFVWNNGAVITANPGAHIRNNNHSGVDGDEDGGSGGDGRIALQCGKVTVNSGSFVTTPTYNNNGFSKFCERMGLSGF